MMKTVSAVASARKTASPVCSPSCAERLVGAVGARRQPVGAEADPGEERDQRELVEGVRILDVLGARRWRASAFGACRDQSLYQDSQPQASIKTRTDCQ